MAAQERFGDQVRFIGVPGLATEEEARTFIAAQGVGGLPHLDDEGGWVWDRFGVTQQRTYVFANDDGTLRITGYGSLEDEIERLIQN